MKKYLLMALAGTLCLGTLAGYPAKDRKKAGKAKTEAVSASTPSTNAVAATSSNAVESPNLGQHIDQRVLVTDVDSLSYVIGYSNSFANKEQLNEYLMYQGSDSTCVEEFFEGLKSCLNFDDDKKEVAYKLGIQAGLQMKMQLASIEYYVFAGDSTCHLSIDKLFLGLDDSRKGDYFCSKDGQRLNEMEVNNLGNVLYDRILATSNKKIYGSYLQESEMFMAEVAKKPGIKKLDNGVYYEVNKEGHGQIPTAEMQVEVEYEGRLIDGTVFDSSAEHGGDPIKCGVSDVIPGWAIALTHMPVGSEWTIYIPYDQAYGAQGSGQILPFSTIIFKVKLISCF